MEERIIELLTRKLAREASAEEVTELNELMGSYPDLLQTSQALEAMWNEKAKEEAVDFYYKRHQHKYRQAFGAWHHNKPAAHFSNQNKRKWLIGSVCMVLVMAAAGYWWYPAPVKPAEMPAYTRIISGKGVRKSVTLPDGTTVWLNADSRLSFQANMSGKVRTVELSGEAFFEVTHLQQRPFIIHTDKVSITVLGTAFNVKAYPGDKKCETTLIRGAIELSTNDGAKQKFILKPSEKFSVIESEKTSSAARTGDARNDGSTLVIEHIATVTLADKQYVPETSWTENRLIFENKTLQDLAPELERWFNVNISIAGKTPAGFRFTGAFANETIEQALTAMTLIKPFNFTVNDKNVTIY